MDAPLLATVNRYCLAKQRVQLPERKNVVKSEIKLCLPFIIPHLVYKFQMICFRGH